MAQKAVAHPGRHCARVPLLACVPNPQRSYLHPSPDTCPELMAAASPRDAKSGTVLPRGRQPLTNGMI